MSGECVFFPYNNFSAYSTMSDEVLIEPPSFLFFSPLVFYACYPDNFIILCGLVPVPDCVL